MKNIIIFLLVIQIQFLVSCSFLSSIPTSPDEITSTKLRFNPEKTTNWEYPSGLKVVFYNYSDVPLVSASLISSCGALCNTPEIPGVQSASISLMKDGGTKSISPELLDKELDSLGASISTSQDEVSTSVSMSSMSEDIDKVFSIFSEVINSPRYDEARFQLWKSLTLDSISKRVESNDTLSEYSFSYLLSGGKFPWFNPVTSKNISNIKIDDIKNYQKTVFKPKNSTLIIVGDLTKEKAKELSDMYNNIASNKTEENNVDKDFKLSPRKSFDSGIYVLSKKFEQSSMQIGYLTPPRDSIDPYNELIFNKLFGASSFSSILFKEIREKRGLAYDASGMISTLPYGGEFNIQLGTKSDKSLEALAAIYELTNDLKINGFDNNDFIDSKNSAIQSFVFKFSEPLYLAVRETSLNLRGLPKDWDSTFIQKIESQNFDEVNIFTNKILSPINFITVIVGPVSIQETKKLFPNIKVCELKFDELPSVGSCI